MKKMDNKYQDASLDKKGFAERNEPICSPGFASSVNPGEIIYSPLSMKCRL